MSNALRTGLASLFSDDPKLAFELAARCGAPPLGPSATIRSESTSLVDPVDPERRLEVDLVLVAYEEGEGESVPVVALAVEILLCRDAERVAAWEIVPRAFQARYGCYGQVFVVSPDPEVRAWASEQVAVRSARPAR
jgi:hypothetical protein